MTDYEVSRSAVLPGDIGRAHALLDDFHEWPAWSPWEELDPDMSRTYSGADSGVGARYAWSGNKRGAPARWRSPSRRPSTSRSRSSS